MAIEVPKVGSLVRMTRPTDWSPRPGPPYTGASWEEGTTFVIDSTTGLPGDLRVTLRPLRNEQKILVSDYYMWDYVEPA